MKVKLYSEKEEISIKETTLITTSTATSLKIDNENTKMILYLLTINNKGKSSQEILCQLAFGTVAMKTLKKRFRCCGMSIPTKIKIMQAIVFPITVYGNISWIWKDRKNSDVLN